MKTRGRMALLTCVLVLSGIPGGEALAADSRATDVADSATVDTGSSARAGVADSEAPEKEETRASEAGDAEIPETEESIASETAEAESAQEERGGRYGIFSSILDFLRGRKANPDPDSDAGRDPDGGTTVDPGPRVDTAPGVAAVPRVDVSPEPDDEGSDVTPNQVHQATVNLIAEIRILRKATGVVDEPRDAGFPEVRTPIDSYVKSLELMEKTARIQRRLGMVPFHIGGIPDMTITWNDIHRNVRTTIEELRRVKRQLVVAGEIEPGPSVDGPKLLHLQRNLGVASLLLDGLVGRPVMSNDVHGRLLQVHDEMASIAASLGAAIQSEPPIVDESREPKDIAQQTLRATYKVISLQSRLGMAASSAPTMTLEDVTPAVVLDAASRLLAEMMRINLYLNNHPSRTERRDSRNTRASDGFALALLVVRNLDLMIEAVDNVDPEPAAKNSALDPSAEEPR